MTAQPASRPLLLGILAVAAIIYLVGNERVQLIDRDEPRYAECAREMLNTGDWVVPRYLGDLRTHKPPLIYWCQAASMAVFGQTGGAARLPSSVAVFLVAVLIAVFVKRHANQELAVWSVLVFCSSVLTIAAAKLSITDATLLLWICIGQGSLYSIWRKPTFAAAMIFWISTALAGLTKGPVVLAVHGSTLVALLVLEKPRTIRWWRNVRPLIGIIILAVIVSPWLILVHQRAPDFLPRLFTRAGRYATGGAEGHAAPPGYYLLLICGLFFPWSILLPAAIHTAWKNRADDPLTRFALAAAIGPWLVMELLINKLPFYILPSFPALAILVGAVIVQKKFFRGAMIGAGAMALGAVILYAILIPSLPSLAASREIGNQLSTLGAGGATKVAMIDYREPSLAFYQGGGAWESASNDLTGPKQPDWAVITSEAWKSAPQAAHDVYELLGTPVPVWMYNDGWRSSQLLIIHRKTP
jgi:4-amino-4-deoxy-L-arabinose transferase-like glycosyltransferase